MPPTRKLKNCRRRWIDVPCLTHSTGSDTRVAKTLKRHCNIMLERPDRAKREPREGTYDRKMTQTNHYPPRHSQIYGFGIPDVHDETKMRPRRTMTKPNAAQMGQHGAKMKPRQSQDGPQKCPNISQEPEPKTTPKSQALSWACLETSWPRARRSWATSSAPSSASDPKT